MDSDGVPVQSEEEPPAAALVMQKPQGGGADEGSRAHGHDEDGVVRFHRDGENFPIAPRDEDIEDAALGFFMDAAESDTTARVADVKEAAEDGKVNGADMEGLPALDEYFRDVQEDDVPASGTSDRLVRLHIPPPLPFSLQLQGDRVVAEGVAVKSLGGAIDLCDGARLLSLNGEDLAPIGSLTGADAIEVVSQMEFSNFDGFAPLILDLVFELPEGAGGCSPRSPLSKVSPRRALFTKRSSSGSFAHVPDAYPAIAPLPEDEAIKVMQSAKPALHAAFGLHLLRSCDYDPSLALSLLCSVEEEYSDLQANWLLGQTDLSDAKAGDDADVPSELFPAFEGDGPSCEYEVELSADRLGMTVENVLERTVVRSVVSDGAAASCGVVQGSLLVRLGAQSTAALSHFETIEQLKQAKRPLRLRLRKLPPSRLEQRRQEMSALLHFCRSEHPSPHPSPRQTPARDTPTSAKSANGGLLASATKTINGHATQLLAAAATRLRGRPFDFDLSSPSAKNAAALPHRRPMGAMQGLQRLSALDGNFLRFVAVLRMLCLHCDSESALPEALAALGHAYDELRDRGAPVSDRLALVRSSVKAVCSMVQWDRECPKVVAMDLREALCGFLDVDSDMDLLGEDDESEGLEATALEAGATENFDDRDGDVGPIAQVLGEMANALTAQERSTQLVPFVHRLATANSVSSRVVCCQFLPVVYPSLPLSQQLQLRGVVTRFIHDEVSIVREYAADALAALAQTADATAVQWLLLLLQRAAADAVATVRARAMRVCLAYAVRLPLAMTRIGAGLRQTAAVLLGEGAADVLEHPLGEADAVAALAGDFAIQDDAQKRSLVVYNREIHLLRCKLVPISMQLAEDKSWSVRGDVAEKLDALCASLNAHWSQVLIDLLATLLEDRHPKVRASALRTLPKIAITLQRFARPSPHGPVVDEPLHREASAKLLRTLLPAAARLVRDKNEPVRKALAQCIASVSTAAAHGAYGSEAAEKADAGLAPLLAMLLKDVSQSVVAATLYAQGPQRLASLRPELREMVPGWTTYRDSALLCDKAGPVPPTQREEASEGIHAANGGPDDTNVGAAASAKMVGKSMEAHADGCDGNAAATASPRSRDSRMQQSGTGVADSAWQREDAIWSIFVATLPANAVGIGAALLPTCAAAVRAAAEELIKSGVWRQRALAALPLPACARLQDLRSIERILLPLLADPVETVRRRAVESLVMVSLAQPPHAPPAAASSALVAAESVAAPTAPGIVDGTVPNAPTQDSAGAPVLVPQKVKEDAAAPAAASSAPQIAGWVDVSTRSKPSLVTRDSMVFTDSDHAVAIFAVDSEGTDGHRGNAAVSSTQPERVLNAGATLPQTEAPAPVESWLWQVCLPQLQAGMESKQCRARLIALHGAAVAFISGAVRIGDPTLHGSGGASAEETLATWVASAADDTVPNVRMSAALCMEMSVKCVAKEVAQKHWMRKVTELLRDPDRCVRDKAAEAAAVFQAAGAWVVDSS